MTKKKLLNFLDSHLIKGLGLLLGLFIYTEAMAMCKFPHNPAVICLLVDIRKAEIKGPNCELQTDVLKSIIPKNVYRYDESLQRIDYTKIETFENNQKERVVYSSTSRCLNLMSRTKSVPLAVKMNCYDENDKLPDFAWVSIDLIGKVQDPWSKEMVDIDCSFIGR